MQDSELAAKLLEDYNYYRAYTRHVKELTDQGRRIKNVVATPERLRVLEELCGWCRSRRIDPRLWLYTLFQARQWLFAPKFEQLMSEKHIVRYRNASNLDFYHRRMREEATARRAQAGDVFDRNRDISPSVESLKRVYLAKDRPEQCMAAMEAETYGFHPRSLVCGRCRLAKQCETKLRELVVFDIIALRRGEITAEEAIKIARAVHGVS